MGNKQERNVVILLISTAVFIGGICMLCYFNFVSSRSINIEGIKSGEGIVSTEIEYMGFLNQSTELQTVNFPDRGTRMDEIQGNGVVTDFVEISGYAYIDGKDCSLFKTAVILEKENGESIKIKTAANPKNTLTVSKNDGCNYDYAYFRSVVPTKRLEKNKKYQISLIYSDEENEYIVSTDKEIMLTDSEGVKVINE